MLSKCANPACSNSSFRYLREGKLFVNESRKSRKLEYYWLCNECCRKMTLIHGAEGFAVVTQKQSA